MTDNQRNKTSGRTKSTGKNIAAVPKRTMSSILHGSVVSSDFFMHHKLKIFVALILVMIYISTKYQCMTSMETIRRLETELEIVRTERIRERSRYMSRIRESSMAQMADSVRPGLAIQERPPFQLAY